MARISKASFRMTGPSLYNSPIKAKIDISSDEKQVALSPHEKKQGTMITGGSKSEEINDLEDRIEFLKSDISDSPKNKIMAKGKMITQRNKLQARLKKMKTKK